MKIFEWITEGIASAFERGFERGQQRVEKLAEARLKEIREGDPMTIEELSTRRLDAPQTTNGRRKKKTAVAKN
jgi:hypothetical protein